jgi:hypothetical protein
MNLPDVIVVVSGGLVQSVFAPPDMHVRIVDFDNLREGETFELDGWAADGPPDGPAALRVLAETLELSAQNAAHQEVGSEPAGGQ